MAHRRAEKCMLMKVSEDSSCIHRIGRYNAGEVLIWRVIVFSDAYTEKGQTNEVLI